ncbi:serine/threonine-protein kinase H1-like [Epinephelus lanceolatus]|uniref:serine/threonine-protein kinase H1-like n=1 Tax=Epinephelus lanceolatus TaxID=310571 RepID=UPI0014454F48|nr:serine/threonine-protein kinase H1-like [Epinephelus lanceolatus]
MGCGNSKVLPEASKKGYVSVVQSLVAFSKARGDDDDELKKRTEKQRGLWFSPGVKNLQPASNSQQRILRDGRHQDRVAKYKDKFEPRVTARYDIKALIGRGSFSRVVRVEHRTTRQPFAIKMMEVEAPEGREVCIAELAVLQRVSHSNVIQLIEVFQFPQRVYMVLELATGGELLDRVVSRGHFTERDATQALRMVLAGVGYLHNLGITHRDLKPENLLYYHPGADSRLLVTDFGLATFGGTGSEVSDPDRSDGGDHTRADRMWFLRTTCGTPEYMAPEVLLRRPYSCAVDMWALGVITYIVLSGSMPFEDDSRTRLYRSIVRGKYSFHGDPWPSVSNLAKDFIQRLLPLDPAARLTADQAIRHPWVVTMAASSSMRNLHRSISQNLRQRASRSSSRCPSSTASSGESNSVGLGKLISLEENQEQQQGRASGLTLPLRAIQHSARGFQEHHPHPTKAPDS